MHSVWSDGAETLESIAEACAARGYVCAGITDHSYGLKVARGMSMEQVTQQHAAIDDINARYEGRFRLYKGIEANIGPDGSLDLEPQELRRFEFVVAAPHSMLRKADGPNAAHGTRSVAGGRVHPGSPAGAPLQHAAGCVGELGRRLRRRGPPRGGDRDRRHRRTGRTFTTSWLPARSPQAASLHWTATPTRTRSSRTSTSRSRTRASRASPRIGSSITGARSGSWNGRRCIDDR